MTSLNQSQQQRQALRKQVRQARRALSDDQQRCASEALLSYFCESSEVKNASRIALYLSVDGEIDTQPLIDACWQQGKEVFLPVLHPFTPGHLLFLLYRKETPMKANTYGIAEPVLDVTAVCPVTEIDVICTPLVAFDAQGQRLGMGGGYYDRTLTTKGLKATPIGLAHDCQQVERLPVEAWDVPLPHILTPSRHWRW
ncbi:5-formyltetrahydrofolate cyclo-ligase [Veronia nyctiphanis]|uniref:5-formyltetrahydrofolate cyclo-ligase n=1 Tax=Veronia nyctiphanis TaxID=1278244 RepID=A0A4Q0YN22_9GAMM|nr:5-formyltetrahydrofolate cyclo-ligase [Veronia nyctiphanis]RXJ72317.1 5-formyltetrahydrofolate cyclo-ligase [Veronia nyctiphanis]